MARISRVIVKIIGDASSFTKTMKQMQKELRSTAKTMSNFGKVTRLNKFKDELKRVNLTMTQSGRIIDKTTGKFVGMENATRRVQRAQDKLDKSMRQMRRRYLGFGLAMLFSGMALKRFATTALRSLLNTWTTIMDKTAKYTNTVGKVTAAWEFLKFSIIDAFLASEMGRDFIEMLFNFIEWINNLSDSWKVTLAMIVIGLIVIGTLMLFFGQSFLFIFGVSQMLNVSMAVTAGLLSVYLLAIILIGIGLVGLYKGWDDLDSITAKVIATITFLPNLLMWILSAIFPNFRKIFIAAINAMGSSFIAFGRLLKAGFSFYIDLFSLVMDFWVALWKDKWGLIRNNFRMSINFFLSGFELMLNGAINVLNKLIKAMNKVPGVNIPKIPKVTLASYKLQLENTENMSKVATDAKNRIKALDSELGKMKSDFFKAKDKYETTVKEAWAAGIFSREVAETPKKKAEEAQQATGQAVSMSDYDRVQSKLALYEDAEDEDAPFTYAEGEDKLVKFEQNINEINITVPETATTKEQITEAVTEGMIDYLRRRGTILGI